MPFLDIDDNLDQFLENDNVENAKISLSFLEHFLLKWECRHVKDS